MSQPRVAKQIGVEGGEERWNAMHHSVRSARKIRKSQRANNVGKCQPCCYDMGKALTMDCVL